MIDGTRVRLEPAQDAGPAADIGHYFDDYVRRVFPERRARSGASWAWPGDEWVDDCVREATYALMMDGLDPATIGAAVEVGPGSGKYSEMLLARTPARLIVFEASAAFLDCLAERCAGDAGRITTHHTGPWTDNRGLLRAHDGPAADLFLGIDVFLMMDLQSALAYLVSAAAMLRPGGRFFGTFGDGLSESGLQRMLRDIGRHSAFDGSPSTRFHWLTPELIAGVLRRLGFADVRIARGPHGGLDIARLYVTGTLTEPMAREDALALLAPAGDSTNREQRA